MRDVIYLLFQLLTALAKLFRPGGSRAVIAENLQVLEIEDIKSLPHVPMSHPIGSIRRELLDQTLFWTSSGQENWLREYQCYYNEC